jgi:hypothetical protein
MNTLSNNPALQMNVANPVINPATRPAMSAVPESKTGGGGGGGVGGRRARGGSSARRRSAASEWTPPTEAEANGHVDRHSPRDLVGETPNQVKRERKEGSTGETGETGDSPRTVCVCVCVHTLYIPYIHNAYHTFPPPPEHFRSCTLRCSICSTTPRI